MLILLLNCFKLLQPRFPLVLHQLFLRLLDVLDVGVVFLEASGVHYGLLLPHLIVQALLQVQPLFHFLLLLLRLLFFVFFEGKLVELAPMIARNIWR